MTDRTTLSLRTSESLSESLTLAADRLDTSKSALCRQILRDAVESGDLDIPEHVRVLAERDMMTSDLGPNRMRDLRAGFSGRVKKQLHSRYYNGDYSGEDIQTLAENYRREARILWPEWSEEDHSEEREEALALVEDLVEKFLSLDATEEGADLDGGEDSETLRADADRLLDSHGARRVEDMLSQRPGVSRAEARDAVEETSEDYTPEPETGSVEVEEVDPETGLAGDDSADLPDHSVDPEEDLSESVVEVARELFEDGYSTGGIPTVLASRTGVEEETAVLATNIANPQRPETWDPETGTVEGGETHE